MNGLATYDFYHGDPGRLPEAIAEELRVAWTATGPAAGTGPEAASAPAARPGS